MPLEDLEHDFDEESVEAVVQTKAPPKKKETREAWRQRMVDDDAPRGFWSRL